MRNKIENKDEIRENNSVRMSQADLKIIEQKLPLVVRKNSSKKRFIDGPALREYLFNPPNPDSELASDIQVYQAIEQDLHKEINQLHYQIEMLEKRLADYQDDVNVRADNELKEKIKDMVFNHYVAKLSAQEKPSSIFNQIALDNEDVPF